ncbi:MAG TPA: energy transducer TonB [Gemmatimonadales bacterium]|nr:energy transducer TonB [Gemmatimonadales bacterium]
MEISRIVAGLALGVMMAGPAAAQPNALNAARELYASARYDEALAMLSVTPAGSPNAADITAVQQYRSLCLLALGRGPEAEEAIGAVVTANPSYQPTEAEASPRVRSAFSDVRQRLLPQIAQTRYSEAKAAFDHKRFAEAEAELREALTLLDDPDMLGRLADLRVLVTGFIDLSVAALAPPPPPPPPTVEAVPPAEPPSTPEPQAPAAERIFTSADVGVTPPVAVRQQLPRLSAQAGATAPTRGLLEVVINEKGRVVTATLRMPVHPIFDQALLAAAGDWAYTPATFNGQPVKFRKMIQVVTR